MILSEIRFSSSQIIDKYLFSEKDITSNEIFGRESMIFYQVNIDASISLHLLFLLFPYSVMQKIKKKMEHPMKNFFFLGGCIFLKGKCFLHRNVWYFSFDVFWRKIKIEFWRLISIMRIKKISFLPLTFWDHW